MLLSNRLCRHRRRYHYWRVFYSISFDGDRYPVWPLSSRLCASSIFDVPNDRCSLSSIYHQCQMSILSLLVSLWWTTNTLHNINCCAWVLLSDHNRAHHKHSGRSSLFESIKPINSTFTQSGIIIVSRDQHHRIHRNQFIVHRFTKT